MRVVVRVVGEAEGAQEQEPSNAARECSSCHLPLCSSGPCEILLFSAYFALL